MNNYQDIIFRPILIEDAPDKVNWYNDMDIRKFLHYQSMFNIEETTTWIKNLKKDPNRYENIIEIYSYGKIIKIGIVGLFCIDLINHKAGFYITIGEKDFQGKGIAKKVSIDFLKHSYLKFNLEKIYLYTDYNNIRAKALYERIGFKQEGLLRNELFINGKYISRYYYGLLRSEFFALYS